MNQPPKQKVKAGNIFSKRSLSPKNQRTNNNPQFDGSLLQKEKRMSGTTPISRLNHNNANHLTSLPDPSPVPPHHYHINHHHQQQQQPMYQSLQYQNSNEFSMNDGHSYAQPSGYGQRKVSRNGNYFNQRNSPMSYYNQDSMHHQHHHHQQQQYTPEVRS